MLGIATNNCPLNENGDAEEGCTELTMRNRIIA